MSVTRATSRTRIPDAAAIARSWSEAQEVWDVRVTLSPPEAWAGKGRSHWQADEPLAYIDLKTRQVVVNYGLLAKIGPKNVVPTFEEAMEIAVRVPSIRTY